MSKPKMLTIRVSDELLEQIDTWRSQQRPILPRAEAVRLALVRF